MIYYVPPSTSSATVSTSSTNELTTSTNELTSSTNELTSSTTEKESGDTNYIQILIPVDEEQNIGKECRQGDFIPHNYCNKVSIVKEILETKNFLYGKFVYLLI